MRMKSYTAETVSEAMELIRVEMGDDAIIISTQDDGPEGGAHVTAAIEDIEPETETAIAKATEPETPQYSPTDVIEIILQSLNYHAVPPNLANRLSEAAWKNEVTTPTLALAEALESCFGFTPLSERADTEDIPPGYCSCMLVGPPGAGKTITTAKLAARYAMAKRPIQVISTDTKRAGGIEQLSAFTRILGLDLKTADSVEDLIALLEEIGQDQDVLIDTPGTNPYIDEESQSLAAFVQAADIKTALVLPAGGDTMESADMAREFASIGAKLLVVTRLDMARRLGGILAAADGAGPSLSDVSITASVAEGLSPINAVSLARLLMPHTDLVSEDKNAQKIDYGRNIDKTPDMTEAKT